MVKPLKEKTNLTRISSVLSLFTLVAFHWPFFRLVLGNIEGGFNGVLITGGLGVLMFALNFLVYYLVLFLGRFVGKCILAFTFIGNAISLYFINTYQVLITDKMMGNVFNTRYSEASGFFSWSAVWYLLFLGVVPCIYIFARRFDYGSWKRFFARTGIALAVSLAIALINMQNWPWIDRNAPKLGSLVMPWSYTVNSVRYYNSVKKQNRKEIPNSAMAATLDTGESDCIHPSDKQTTANRLAGIALMRDYGYKYIDAGTPVAESFCFENGIAKVRFDVGRNGMSPISTDIPGFELAGEDRVFHPATARVDENDCKTIIVKSEAVPEPVAVRYAIRNYSNATLFNCFGVPASPFRSDDW